MFVLLPEDLSIYILNLLQADLLVLSALDVAHCNHSDRQHWLTVASAWSHLKAGLAYDAKAPIEAFIYWLHARKIRVTKLCVKLSLLDSGLESSVTGLALPSVTSIKFTPAASNNKSLRQFLSMFPSLTSIDVENCKWDDRHLVDLLVKPLTCPLRKLHLRGCSNLSVASVGGLIATMYETLEELHCDGLDDWAVERLAQNCRIMKRISWQKCSLSLQTQTLLSFCINNSMLCYVNLDSSAVNSSLVERMVVACRKLRNIVLGTHCPVTFELVNTLAVKASLQVTLNNVIIDLTNRGGGVIDCEIKWTGETSSTCRVESVMNSIRLPICGLIHATLQDWVCFRKRSLHRLEQFQSLKRVDVCFDDDVDREDVQLFLRHCPKLICLNIAASTPRNLIGDEEIRNLPLTCPLLCRLCIVDCAASITDCAVIVALEGLALNNIRSLTFHHCGLLTDAILPAIEEHCPNITLLSICGTAISKEGALDFLSRMVPKSTFLEFDAPTEDIKMWLKEQVTQRQLARHANVLIDWW